MPTSSPTTFAPRSVRRRKIENGISGLADARLDEDERGEQAERERQQHQRLSRVPARLLGVHQRVDEDRQAGGHRHRAGHVEGGRAVVARSRRAGAAPAARPPGRSARSRTAPTPSPGASVSTPPSKHAHGAARRRPPRPRPPAPCCARRPRRRWWSRSTAPRGRSAPRPCPGRRGRRSAAARSAARPPRQRRARRTGRRPTMKIRRRPSRSARRPPSSRKPPKVSV